MALLDAFPPQRSGDNPSSTAVHQAAQGLESLILRRILSASGAFKGSNVAGGGIRADLFVEAIADAVAKSGGIGLARQLEDSMNTSTPPPTPSSKFPVKSTSPDPALQSPLGGEGQLTSPFGMRRDPMNGHLARHGGVDLAAPEGTLVRAALGGVVRRAGGSPGYGNMVEVEHGNGTRTLYGHASELLVKQGDTVQAGDPIAKVGHSGRATGDHLHFELRQGGHTVDPTRALKIYQQRSDKSVAQPLIPVRRGST